MWTAARERGTEIGKEKGGREGGKRRGRSSESAGRNGRYYASLATTRVYD